LNKHGPPIADGRRGFSLVILLVATVTARKLLTICS
jgi:hypothetical protein